MRHITFDSMRVTVGAGVTIDSGAGAGDISFSSTLDGGQTVVLDAGSGGINFNGVVGATALTSLATTGTTGPSQLVRM